MLFVYPVIATVASGQRIRGPSLGETSVFQQPRFTS